MQHFDWHWILKKGHHPRIEFTFRDSSAWSSIDDAITHVVGYQLGSRNIVSRDVNGNIFCSRRYRLPNKFKLPHNRWRLDFALKKLVNNG